MPAPKLLFIFLNPLFYFTLLGWNYRIHTFWSRKNYTWRKIYSPSHNNNTTNYWEDQMPSIKPSASINCNLKICQYLYSGWRRMEEIVNLMSGI